MIRFEEHPETGYAMRTYDNARLADLTIAFAIDFTTAGEILTRKAAYGKYLGIDFDLLLNVYGDGVEIACRRVIDFEFPDVVG